MDAFGDVCWTLLEKKTRLFREGVSAGFSGCLKSCLPMRVFVA